MQKRGMRLYKAEKLCSQTALDMLFGRTARPGCPPSSKSLCYPLRAVWMSNPVNAGQPAKFMIMVPKRRLRHAVDRVQMRRRIREAYRLNRNLFEAQTPGLNIAFIYVADTLKPYAAIDRAMRHLLTTIAASVNI